MTEAHCLSPAHSQMSYSKLHKNKAPTWAMQVCVKWHFTLLSGFEWLISPLQPQRTAMGSPLPWLCTWPWASLLLVESAPWLAPTRPPLQRLNKPSKRHTRAVKSMKRQKKKGGSNKCQEATWRRKNEQMSDTGSKEGEMIGGQMSKEMKVSVQMVSVLFCYPVWPSETPGWSQMLMVISVHFSIFLFCYVQLWHLVPASLHNSKSKMSCIQVKMVLAMLFTNLLDDSSLYLLYYHINR